MCLTSAPHAQPARASHQRSPPSGPLLPTKKHGALLLPHAAPLSPPPRFHIQCTRVMKIVERAKARRRVYGTVRRHCDEGQCDQLNRSASTAPIARCWLFGALFDSVIWCGTAHQLQRECEGREVHAGTSCEVHTHCLRFDKMKRMSLVDVVLRVQFTCAMNVLRCMVLFMRSRFCSCGFSSVLLRQYRTPGKCCHVEKMRVCVPQMPLRVISHPTYIAAMFLPPNLGENFPFTCGDITYVPTALNTRSSTRLQVLSQLVCVIMLLCDDGGT